MLHTCIENIKRCKVFFLHKRAVSFESFRQDECAGFHVTQEDDTCTPNAKLVDLLTIDIVTKQLYRNPDVDLDLLTVFRKNR